MRFTDPPSIAIVTRSKGAGAVVPATSLALSRCVEVGEFPLDGSEQPDRSPP